MCKAEEGRSKTTARRLLKVRSNEYKTEAAGGLALVWREVEVSKVSD